MKASFAASASARRAASSCVVISSNATRRRRARSWAVSDEAHDVMLSPCDSDVVLADEQARKPDEPCCPHPGNLNAVKQGVHSPRLIQTRAVEIASELAESSASHQQTGSRT